MSRPFRVIAAGATALALALSACGSTGGSNTTTTTAGAVAGPVTVFAAASLTESFGDVQTTLKSTQPGLAITYSFAGSGALVTQIQQGAPADVIATADTSSMKTLSDAGLVETPTTFAKNKLEILVAPGNPKGIHTLADLAQANLKVVLEDSSVPAGKYAAQILQKAGVTVKPVSNETDVKSAVAKVTDGDADATIVYVTDVEAAGAKGQGVVIPDAQNAIAEYPIAIVKDTKHQSAAAAFVNYIVSGAGQSALQKRGFLAAN